MSCNVIMAGAAPDGSPVIVTIDLAASNEEYCPAEWGPIGLKAGCTLLRDHPGPWHVATTEDTIVKVWAA